MRHAIPDDTKATVKLLESAFAPSTFESNLVAKLIVDDTRICHWVLQKSGNVIAYACYSLAYRGRQEIGWHLAPVAVHPAWQNQGYGSNLIRMTLARAPISECPVFVLGDPAFYQRFGFCPMNEPKCPFDPTNEHFLASRYNGQDHFVIGYERQFWAAETDFSAMV